MKINMNPNFEKAVARSLEASLERRNQQYKDLVSRHQGGDVEAVKQELVRIYTEEGGELTYLELTDADLTAHAEAIVSGQTITPRLKPLGRARPIQPSS